MATDDGGFPEIFGATEEEQFHDWIDWGDRFVDVVSLASQRVSLAIAAGGFALAGSNLIEKAPMLSYLSLGAAGVFGVGLAVASLTRVARR